LFPISFLVQEDIEDLKLLSLMHIEQIRKNTIHLPSYEKSFKRLNVEARFLIINS
jgi:hypothetical protein